MPAEEALSRKLSKLLRHRLRENGLGDVVRPDGYVPLTRVLALEGFQGVSAAEIAEVVRNNDKQRFSLTEALGEQLIRANQGHTVQGLLDDEAMLQRITLEAARHCAAPVHGTYTAAWGAIQAGGGLKRMARRHVHLAAGLPGEGGVISGMRRSCEVAVYIDLARAVADGIPFYASANGVILTPGLGPEGLLPLEYFTSVLHLSSGSELLPTPTT